MVVGITMVKDEADIIESTVQHMLNQVDHVIVADNGSTDGTREILEDMDVELHDDPEIGYYQSAKMSLLAEKAELSGADWVVPFDADEFWYSPHGRIGDVLGQQPACISTAAMYNHVATGFDRNEPPIDRMEWRLREPNPMNKVACRPSLRARIHQGNHGVSYDVEEEGGLLVIRHFPYRSPQQFVRKVRNGAAAYAATSLPSTDGQHWRDYGELLKSQGEESLHYVFRRYWWYAEPNRIDTLIRDPAKEAVT